jgi:MFS family permease
MMVEAVPRAALMLIGGALTDRISPRSIMIVTAAVRAVLVATLAICICTKKVEIWEVYVLSFIFGVADAFAAPAAQTLLPSILAPAQLPTANALSQGAQQVAMLLLPAPAGLIIATLGIAAAFSIDAVSFLFIIGALLMLRGSSKLQSNVRSSNIAHAVLEGLRYVKNDVAVKSLMLVAAVLNFCISGPMSVGIAFLAKSEFGSAAAFGLLISAVAAGSLTGLALAATQRQRRRGLTLVACSTIVGLSTISISIIHVLPGLLLCLFVIGASAGFLNVQLLAWFQQRVEGKMLGRVMSVLLFASLGLMPLSLAAAGVAIQWSLHGMFAGAGLLMLTVTTTAALRRQVREID